MELYSRMDCCLADIQNRDIRFAEHAEFVEVTEAGGFAEKTLRENFVKAGAGKMVVL